MRKLHFICLGLLLCGWIAGIARADTFQLNDGQSMTGEVVSYNAEGLILRLPDDKYSDRVLWTKFSQEDLKRLGQNNRIAPLVEPYIEVSQEDKIKKTEVPTQQPPRLHRPKVHSLLGAMFSSGLGLLVVLLVYAANIYAAYEVAIFRARPVGLLCGLAAIPLLGFACPIIFLSLPTRPRQSEEEEESQPASIVEPPTFSVPNTPSARTPAPNRPQAPQRSSPPTTLRPPTTDVIPSVEGAALKPSQSTTALPTTQMFQRGAFMFNRRFFETKFPGYFALVRRDADKDMVLLIKGARGEYTVDRFTRISASEVHVQIRKGEATEEVMVPFSEVKEIILKHKDARA